MINPHLLIQDMSHSILKSAIANKKMHKDQRRGQQKQGQSAPVYFYLISSNLINRRYLLVAKKEKSHPTND